MMKNGKRYLLVAIALLLATVLFSGLAMAQEAEEAKPIKDIKLLDEGKKTIEKKLENGVGWINDVIIEEGTHYEIDPVDFTEGKIAWEIDDDKIASIVRYSDYSATVRPLKAGTVTITAKVLDKYNKPTGKSATFTVKFIEVPVTAIVFSKYSVKVEYDSWVTDDGYYTFANYIERVDPDNATYQDADDFEWSSSDNKILFVNKDGTFTAKAVGKATVTATAKDAGKKTEKIEVEVYAKPVTSITFDPTTFEVETGEYLSLADYVKVEPEGENIYVRGGRWYSSDPDIFNVGEMQAGWKEGTATITLEYTNYDRTVVSGSCTVTVKAVELKSLSFSKSTIELDEQRDTLNLYQYLKYGPIDATRRTWVEYYDMYHENLKWESSNEEVVTVDDGWVYVEGPGTAVVTVTCISNPAVNASVVITVTKDKIMSVKFDRKAATLYFVKKEGKLSDDRNLVNVGLVYEPSKAFVKTISAETSNAKVAIPDPNGYLSADSDSLQILAVGKGKCVITLYVSDGTNNFTASLKVTVTDKGPQAKLNKKNLTLTVGKKATLVAKDSSKTKLAGKWSSSDKTIAKVNKKGVVKAVKPGRCVITFTPKSKSIKSVSCVVTVK